MKPVFRNKVLLTTELVGNDRITVLENVQRFILDKLTFSLQETNQRCYGKDGSSGSEII